MKRDIDDKKMKQLFIHSAKTTKKPKQCGIDVLVGEFAGRCTQKKLFYSERTYTAPISSDHLLRE